jgi:hypothetical protein
MADCCDKKAEARRHGMFEGPVGDDWFDCGCKKQLEVAKASIQALNDSRPAREALAEQVGRIMMMTKDPTVMFPRDTAGKPPAPMPAITSLLYRVCDNDQTKFEEACRLVELFIVAALKEKTNGE